MLKVEKTESNGRVAFVLNGVIDDMTDLAALLGPAPTDATGRAYLNIVCGQIVRLNSVGVKNWIRYFDECRRRGTSIAFYECSPAIIEQLNMITNFLAGGRLISLQLPYSCYACKNHFTRIAKPGDLMPTGTVVDAVPDEKCPKCSGPAEFDDMVESYLTFLSRAPA